MIPKKTLGGVKVFLGRRLGIFPRHHKAAIFFNFDETPNPKLEQDTFTGDMTVHAHTPYCGKCCGGVATVLWKTLDIHFKSSSGAVNFFGHFDPVKKSIAGKISLNDADGLTCEDCPIEFRECADT